MFSTEEKAFFAPFAVFLAFLGLNGVLEKVTDGLLVPWWLGESQYWIYPLQTVVCGLLLFRWWRHYELARPARPCLAIGAGIVVILAWMAPQLWLGFPRRLEGFDPQFFGTSGWAYVVTVAMRFVRMCVIVPLVEELFWRGYLLRTLISQPFEKVPVGTLTWTSFLVVTVGFCLEHQMADWPAALLAGAIYNLVAWRTRSLSSCVLAHAVSNLILGLYVMRTGQWGFW